MSLWKSPCTEPQAHTHYIKGITLALWQGMWCYYLIFCACSMLTKTGAETKNVNFTGHRQLSVKGSVNVHIKKENQTS